MPRDLGIINERLRKSEGNPSLSGHNGRRVGPMCNAGRLRASLRVTLSHVGQEPEISISKINHLSRFQIEFCTSLCCVFCSRDVVTGCLRQFGLHFCLVSLEPFLLGPHELAQEWGVAITCLSFRYYDFRSIADPPRVSWGAGLNEDRGL